MNILKRLISFLLCSFLLLSVTMAQQDSLYNKAVLQIDTDSNSSIHSAGYAVLQDTDTQKNSSPLDVVIRQNVFLNSKAALVSRLQVPRKYVSKDVLFYILSTLLLLFGILKLAYPRYFTNLIRVFFNTSLRQGQLTDQLLQARQPSMFFNIFFVIIGGCYLYLLLNHFEHISYDNWRILLVCIAGIVLLYAVKYCTLKFAGWVTGYGEEAETYIFIVFLINKIISICLIPVVLIMAFSTPPLVNVTIIASYTIILLMLIMRFFRSYGLLQPRLKVSGFHFFLYISGVELLPLLLIYKATVFFMANNL